jgi:pSer/pThr/pTyr-binding forkhead associated (FHA) protein
MDSRNGTFVNGDRVAEEAVLLHGDNLRVGPWSSVVIGSFPAAGQTAAGHRHQNHARTAESSNVNSTSDLGDIGAWLDEADSVDKQRRTFDPETRQFHLDETVLPVDGEKTATATSETKPLAPDSKKEREKKAPGKLPPRPSTQKKDSREAAADMLKKFFNRR